MLGFHRRLQAGVPLAVAVWLASWPIPCTAQQEEQAAKRLAPGGPESAALYGDAANLQNHAELPLAAEEWRRFLTQFPEDPMIPQVHHYLGICLLQQKAYPEAAQEFAAVVQLDPDSDFLEESFLNLGWSLYNQGIAGQQEKLSEAIEVFDRFLKRFPQGKLQDQALFYRGECHYLKGAPAEAEASYQAVVHEHPKSPQRADALYALGVLYQDGERHQEAAKVLSLFTEEFPEHELKGEIHLRLAESLMKLQRYEEAAGAFDRASQSKDFALADHAYLRRGVCLELMQQHDDAAAHFAKFESKFPASKLRAAAAMGAARGYFHGKRWDEAEAWFRKAEVADPALKPEAEHWIARLQLQSSRPQLAIQTAQAALEGVGDSVAARTKLMLDLADARYADPSQRASAARAYLDIVEQYPDASEAGQALYNVAYAALDSHDYPEAIRRSDQFLKLYPQHDRAPDVRHVRGESLLSSRKYQAAEQEFSRLIADFPEHAEVPKWRARLGLALQSQGKHDAVLAALAKGEPGDSPESQAESTYLSAISLAEKGNRPQAKKLLADALQASPKNPQADAMLLYLATLDRKSGDREAAQAALRRLREEFPQSPLLDRAMLLEAELAYDASDLAEAARCYAAIPSTWPKSSSVPTALHGQGWVELRQGHLSQADTLFTRILEEFPQHELKAPSLQARALARQRNGDFAGGLADSESFLATGPTGEALVDGLFIQGLCQSGLKRMAEAEKTFERILRDHSDYSRLDHVIYELAWLQQSDRPADALALFRRLAGDFPESSHRAEANLHVGDAEYSAGEFARAESAYRAAAASTQDQETAETAAHKLGFLLFQRKRWDDALHVLTGQRQDFPNGTLASDAGFLIAEIHFAQKDYARAVQAYESLRDVTLKSPASTELLRLHAGQSLAQLERFEESLDWLRPVWLEGDAMKWKAGFEMAQSLRRLKRLPDARAAYQEVADKCRDETGARARFMLGELGFAEQNFTAALREFRKLMYGYGGDQAPAEVKAWQIKGALEAGRSALKLAEGAADARAKQETIEQARKYFSFAVDRDAKSAEGTAAQEQLNRLKSQNEPPASAPPG